MKKFILTLILTIVYTITKVDCLQCYVCDDCTTVKDTHLVTCGGSIITTTVLPTATTTIFNTSAITTTLTNMTTPVTTAQTLTNTTTTPSPSVSETNATAAPNSTIYNGTIRSHSELRTKREVMRSSSVEINPEYRATNVTLVYYCYDRTIKVNNTKEKTVQGCGSKPESSNQTICNVVATDPMVTSCRTCFADKCNSAFATRISLLLLIIATPLSVY